MDKGLNAEDIARCAHHSIGVVLDCIAEDTDQEKWMTYMQGIRDFERTLREELYKRKGEVDDEQNQ